MSFYYSSVPRVLGSDMSPQTIEGEQHLAVADSEISMIG